MTGNNKSKFSLDQWQKSFEKETKIDSVDNFINSSDEGIDIKPIYTEQDLHNLEFIEKETLPGIEILK